MHKKTLTLLLVGVVSLSNYVFCAVPAFAQTPHVVSTSPAQNELNVPLSTNISVTFDIDMDETTINDSTFVVNARSTGLHTGTITYDGPSRTATFDPAEDFDEGEVVTVVLAAVIESSGGIPLDSAYAWSFTSVVYDGSGTFAADSVQPAGDGRRSVFSADLDGDGDLDLAAANSFSDNISVLLNDEDGTFATHSTYPMGVNPWSVFSADLDGDGDLDLAAANGVTNDVSILLNASRGDANGDGVIDIADAIYLLNYLFKGDPPPGPLEAGDANCDGIVDIGDAIYLLNYLFKNGPPPGCP